MIAAKKLYAAFLVRAPAGRGLAWRTLDVAEYADLRYFHEFSQGDGRGEAAYEDGVMTRVLI